VFPLETCQLEPHRVADGSEAELVFHGLVLRNPPCTPPLVVIHVETTPFDSVFGDLPGYQHAVLERVFPALTLDGHPLPGAGAAHDIHTQVMMHRVAITVYRQRVAQGSRMVMVRRGVVMRNMAETPVIQV